MIINGAAETLLKQAYLRPLPTPHIARAFSRLTLGANAKSTASSPAFLQLIQASRASSQHRSAAGWPSRTRGVPASHSGSERHRCTGNSQQCRSANSEWETEGDKAGISHRTWQRPRIQRKAGVLSTCSYLLWSRYLIYDLYDYICFAEGRRSSSQHQPTAWVTL